MKTLKLFLPILFLLTIVSCKKKEDAPEPAATTTGSTSTSTVPAYYGVLVSSQFDFVTSGTITSSGGSSQAYFSTSTIFNTSSISEGAVSPAYAGTVSVNSTAFKATNQSGSIFYQDTTSVLFNSPYVWAVSGNTIIPTINYTYTATRPTYTGFNTLQDTIKLSQNNTINLTGISGADEIVITIFGNGVVQRNLAGNVTSATFTSAELSGMSATTSGNISVSCYKNTYQSFGGKYYKFKAGYQLLKTIVVQ